jgi:DNA-binding IclR family transcriptional regulator
MSELRKAAGVAQPEALRLADLVDDSTLAKYHEHKNIVAELRRLHEENEALRHALAQPEQEALTLDRGCWERGCCAYDTRDGDGVIVYVAPVNMSQERVDETVKSEHEEKNS